MLKTRWIAMVTVLGATACVTSMPVGGTEPDCVSDNQCVNDTVLGTCEALGVCSFPDVACASGKRYDAEASSSVADQCVSIDEDDTAIDDTATDDSGTNDNDDDATDDGVAEACPDNPGTCASNALCNDSCGGPFSPFDADGCPRPHCEVGACPAGRTCVALGDWGQCDASTATCEPEGDSCACEATADCSDQISVCVPDQDAPPPIEQCIADNPLPAFSIQPSPGEGELAADCDVTALDPIALDCVGDFNGAFELTLNSSAPHDLQLGEAVVVNYWFYAQDEYGNEWLTITRDAFPAEPIVAVQADALIPPGVGAFAWPTNVDIDVVDVGCPPYLCADTGVQVTGQGLAANGQPFATGETGTVPGKFGGETVTLTVLEARDRACGITLGGQPSYYRFVLVQAE